MHSLVLALTLLRAPAIVALLAAAVLVLPGQSREVFHAIREASALALFAETARACAFIILLSVTLLASSLLLIRVPPAHRAAAVTRHRALLEALAFALAAIPVAAVGLVNIVAPEQTPHRLSWIHQDNVKYAVTVLLIGVLLGALQYFDGVRGALVRCGTVLCTPLSNWTAARGLSAVGVLIACLIAIIVFVPKLFADALGPVGVILLFLAVLCATSSLLTYLYDRYQIPGVTLLVIAALAWAAIGINNNHHVRLLKETASEPQTAVSAFTDWLQKRSDLRDYDGRHYPVYLVTAEGGGLYAAAHAASALARIQDNCPAFARHVFAISGVSGGSLGAAVFAALVKTYPPARDLERQRKCPVDVSNDGPMQRAVFAYFKEDLLTPALAAGLFPDFFQRFWPLPVAAFDRARALERGYEETWKKIMRTAGHTELEDLFSESSRKLWVADQDVPALLLNATIVQFGDRAVIAPFTLTDYRGFGDLELDSLNKSLPMRLSTAIGVSARFPLVTPVALYQDPASKEKFQYGDGGYYENSGVQTAINLIERIADSQSNQDRPKTDAGRTDGTRCAPRNEVIVETPSSGKVAVCFKFITIRLETHRPSIPPVGELLSPVLAMYQARTGKGWANLQLANYLYCGGQRCGYGGLAETPHVYVKYLRMQRPPLGWYFSIRTLQQATSGSEKVLDCRKLFSERLGNQKPGAPLPGPFSRAQLYDEENACLHVRISRDLNG